MNCKLILVVTLMAVCLTANAVTLYVPDDYSTIQAAIDATVDGDSVVIDPGEWEGFYVVGGANDLTILGSGAFTDDPTIVHECTLNPIGSAVWIEKVSGWELADFAVDQDNPASASGFELWDTQDFWVHHIDVIEVAHPGSHGIILDGTDNTLVEKCLVRGANYDVVTCWYGGNSNVTFRNLTISANGNGIINRATVNNWEISNCLVYDCGDTGVEIHYWSSSYDIQYNNSWGNSGSEYQGFSPDTTNISEDPDLLSSVGVTGWEGFMLLLSSPCIDAGDPGLPLDPDGTISDIGCFYYDQNNPMGSLTVTVEPVEPPVVIPPEGGTFDYTASITCDTTNYAFFDAWVEFTLPNSVVVGPKFMRSDNLLAPGDSVGRDLSLHVSAFAMSGTYELTLLTGMYPDTIYVSDSFTFEKSGVDALSGGNEPAYAVLSGWDESEYIELPVNSVSVAQDISLGSHPNPFNPHTSLSFTLPASGRTSLKIFDLAGRTVATLLDREMQAGSHSVQFDGSQLASGVYLAVLNNSKSTAVQRILLMK
ncbi:hypothetical protein CEE37_00490 [candidate division LCP-89 bacterium B3_LCP]|uniref:Secretion system C-terminal sorting domain-containing protein n=1 Tax=candidate division LCP-89 bacterium B3_LCP TaxID=2012998 RepID=A0A532V4T7_UNCL8|nr:MAG: hypothetical protein CEE37_00490 [candidate division LCP-89 bacterium B3_LCP]